MNEFTPNPTGDGTGADVVVTTATDTAAGTEQTDTVKTGHVVETVDYRQKFIDSSKGAQALLEENKRLKAERAVLEQNQAAGIKDLPIHSPSTEALYPGFEQLDEEAQRNLLAYTEAVTRKATEAIYQDPAIAFAKNSYNETKWDNAFNEVASKFPELASAKEQFKSEYYSPHNVPDNIGNILESMAKVYLFDKARDIGADEGKLIAQRVQLEEPTGGDKTLTVHRSLAEWQRIAQENPAKFATLKQQYEADLASGRLKE